MLEKGDEVKYLELQNVIQNTKFKGQIYRCMRRKMTSKYFTWTYVLVTLQVVLLLDINLTFFG